jgi:hypothetical protein
MLPTLPFGGHSGSMGSDASRERAEREDEEGISEWRQRQIIDLLAQAGPMGLTWKEVGAQLNWHHGQATGALSPMHAAGIIDALKQTRDGSTIYVIPEHLGGRETREYGGSKTRARLGALEERVSTLTNDVAQVTSERDAAVLETTRLERVLRGMQEALAREQEVVRHRGAAVESMEQAIAAKNSTIDTLQAQIAALRIWRWVLRLEPAETEFSMRLERAVTATQDRDGAATVPVTLDSMRMMSGLLGRLRRAQARIDNPGGAEGGE